MRVSFPKTVMTSYRIVAPHFVAGIIVDLGRVIQAAPILGWSVGKEFSIVRDYCRDRGWEVQPIPELKVPTMIEYNGILYEFQWSGRAIVRITKHEEGEESVEVPFSELPEYVKDQI